ncbi:MAG: SPASM domain-containing protein, partial [Acidimicrobiales bacterium]
IAETPMIELVASEKQRKFGLAKREDLPEYCRSCDVRFACHGGCPKNRFIRTPDGEDGLNYLCAGYKSFFTHIDRPMRLMSQLLRQNRAPSEVSAILAKDADELA